MLPMAGTMTSSSEKPAPAPGKRGGIVVPYAPRWYQRIAAWGIFVLIRVVALTLRYRREDQFTEKGSGPVIYCAWHNRLVLSILGYHAYAWKRNPTQGLAALVSASKDGGFLTAILECFKVQPVRGSSSRRGAQAMLELTTWAERGYDLAITPDGPRGPRYVVQEGVMSLAQVTGLLVVPFSYYLPWKIQVKSWDGFQIPLPFSRCHMVMGKPLRVPREATDEQRESLRQELESRLREISRD